MAASSRFVTMEEAMAELQVDKAELDQMIADGNLSPIRDGGKVKFRRDQVEAMKHTTETEATVVFDAAGEADDGDTDSSDEFDDGLFIVGENAAESSDDEATIISIPGSDAAISDSSDVLIGGDEGSDEDSDQTSIIPPSSDNVEPVKDDEESIFDFGTEELGLEDTDHAPSSSDILAESDSSSDIITAAEDSSSDILSVSVEDDDGTETVSDILELSDESDDALASVQVDSPGADDESTASEEVVGSLLDTLDSGDDSGSELLAVGEEGLETADTIDLTMADDDATATVAEVLEEPDATEPGVLTAAEETLEGVGFDDDDGYAADAGAGMGLSEMALPEGIVFGEPAGSPMMSAVLVIVVLVLLFGGAFLVMASGDIQVAQLDSTVKSCQDLVLKALASAGMQF